MDNLSYIKNYISTSISVKQKLLSSSDVLEAIDLVSREIVQRYQAGRKVLIAGNGGSAADAQHIAAEFVSRFFFDRPGLPAIALTTDTSMLTAIGNDYGFENIFSRQLEANGADGDIFIGISTSGNSKNIVKAVAAAKEKGVLSVAFCGEAGVLKDLADIAICVPSDCTPYIQECHICIGHVICAIVEQELYGKK